MYEIHHNSIIDLSRKDYRPGRSSIYSAEKAKLEHFYMFDPVEPESWPLTFSTITTKRYVVDRSNYTLSESVWQEESVGIIFNKIEETFEFDPLIDEIK